MTSKKLNKQYITIASTFVVAVLFMIIAIIAVVYAAVRLPLKLLGKAKTALKENGKR